MSPAAPAPSSTRERIYAMVTRIPRGRVATYGQVAVLCGLRSARQVGYALSALPERTRVPWHRVVNARGAVSARSAPAMTRQYLVLAREGIACDEQGRISLERYRWRPRAAIRGAPQDAFRSFRRGYGGGVARAISRRAATKSRSASEKKS